MMNNKGKVPPRLTDARLSVPPSEELNRYVNEPTLKGEMIRFKQYLLCDLAHVVMLAEEGIIPREDAAKILRVVRELQQLDSDKFSVDPSYGTLQPQLEAHVLAKLGEEVGGKLHTGRSRIDQGSCVNRLYARDQLLGVMQALIELQGVFIDVSERHVHTLMPGYTHLQHAQPWTFGHYLCGWFYAYDRDFQRLRGAFERTNLNPLGATALAGTSWPVNRRRTAELLGFDGVAIHSKDAGVFSPEYPAEIAATLAILMSNLGRLASDLYVWSTYEFSLVETSDELCGTSSMMPQKKNPYALEVTKGLGGEAIGWFASELGVLKMATSTDCDAFFLSGTLPRSSSVAQNSCRLMAKTLETLKVKVDRMRTRAGAFWSTASNLADILVRERGLSFRQAHHVAARLVRIAVEEGVTPTETTPALVERASNEVLGKPLLLPSALIREALDPEAFVKSRTTEGSVNPEKVLEMLDDCRNRLNGERKWLEAREVAISASLQQLERVIDGLLTIAAVEE